MRRPKPVWINTGLAILLTAAALAAYLSIGDPTQAQTNVGRNATAQIGTVTSTVTGTGNAASANQLGVNFVGSGGTLTAVYVQTGQKVTVGQPLARIDNTTAQQSLQTAQAQLASAQAQYDQTVGGATSVQRQKDQLAVQSAQLNLNSAKSTLANAKQQLATDTTQQNQLVAQAQAALKAGTGTQAQLTQAQQARTTTLNKDRQAITQAQQQVATSQNQVSQAQLTVTADNTPVAASVAQASASLNSAKIAVAQAQKTLSQTLLTAPQAGTVISVNGKVGQAVSGGGSSSASSSASSGSGSGSSGSGSAGGAGSSGSGGSGSSGSSSSGSGSSFVVLADLDTLTVTANIAEADAAAVKVGQDASVTFSATSTTVTGKVTQISLSSLTSNNVIQYPVTVTLQNVPSGVRLGATANVSITTGSADNALYVPSSAVTSLGQTHTVTVLRGTAQTVVPVQIGLVGDRGTQILNGLSAGDTVVLPTSTSTGTTGGFPRLGGLGLGGRG
jgi:HlyD family secretion protein